MLNQAVRVARMVYGDPWVQRLLFLQLVTVLTLWKVAFDVFG